MSTVFLFGAGASYGSEDVHPNPPPLGKDLFKALHEFGGIARTVGPDLARLFAENFELGMSEFFRTRNPESTPFLREMAMYLARFTPGPRNLYRRLIEIGRGKEIVLSTTNYDLLIEAAASDAGYLTSHRRPPLPPERLSLLKIHGSIHFLPDLLGSTFIDCRFDTTHAMPGAAAFGASIRLASSNSEVWDFCTSQNSISPAIAMYAPGKRVLVSPDYVIRQQEHWRAEVARADDIFLIGLRPNPEDDHIWGPLGRAAGRLSFVGYEADEFTRWAHAVGHEKVFPVAQTFADALPAIEERLEMVREGT